MISIDICHKTTITKIFGMICVISLCQLEFGDLWKKDLKKRILSITWLKWVKIIRNTMQWNQTMNDIFRDLKLGLNHYLKLCLQLGPKSYLWKQIDNIVVIDKAFWEHFLPSPFWVNHLYNPASYWPDFKAIWLLGGGLYKTITVNPKILIC